MLENTITLRLLNIFSNASASQRSIGLNWYLDAHKIAKKHGISHNKACGVISALSPNNKWNRNILDADKFIKEPSLETKACTYTVNRVKALKILSIENDSDISSILGGTKTKSFYDNILNKNSEMVTVDLWMYRAAELPMSNKNYKLISDSIRSISSVVKLKPYQVQAILWVVIRDSTSNKVVTNAEKITVSIAS